MIHRFTVEAPIWHGRFNIGDVLTFDEGPDWLTSQVWKCVSLDDDGVMAVEVVRGPEPKSDAEFLGTLGIKAE